MSRTAQKWHRSQPRQSPPPAAAGATIIKGPHAVELLTRHIDEVGGSVGWRAIIFHLSRLNRAHRAEKHLQIAANMLEEVVREHSGRLFLLANNDLVLVCRGIKARTIDNAEETLRYLFNDDAFAQRTKGEGGFSTSFDLEREQATCLAALRKRPAAPRPPAAPGTEPASTGDGASGPLDPARVAELLSTVGRLDPAPLLRRQTVWKVGERHAPVAHSEEIFVSVKALRDAIGPAFDIANDRQLFAYLTRWLDSHMLKSLSWEHFSVGPPLSFNINLATIGSPEFAAFEKRRPAAWRGRVMLEFQLGDVWADLPTFLKTGQQLKRDGYLRCLDGVVFSALPFVNLRRLDVDYVKVIWEDGLLALGETALRELCQSIADCGKDRIILSRCGREEALKIGRALGIRLFQGWRAIGGQPQAEMKVGDAVELRYAEGGQRLGSIRAIGSAGVTVLLGGAEAQSILTADARRFRPLGAGRWLVEI